MLHFLRRHSQSKVIQVIFLSIIAVFVLWGVGGIVNSQNHLTTLAEVDGHRIEPVDFQRAFRGLREAYREAYKGRFTPELEKSLGLRQRALDGLIDHQILASQAARLGLEVSDQELRDAVVSEAAFQADGRFDKDAYVRTLRYYNLTPAEYESGERQDLAIKRLQATIQDGIAVSDAEVRDQVVLNLEKASLALVRFRASEYASSVQVSDDEIGKYFEAHKENYREPERVKLELIAYPAAKFEEGIALADSEISDFYELHKEDHFTQPREVRARHILIKLPQDADAAAKAAARKKIDDVAAKLKAGADFAELATKYSEDEGSAKKGGDLGFFGEGRMVKPFEEAAFALAPGKVSDVVETPFGFHIIKVEEVHEERTKPLEEVKDEIASTLRHQEASDAAHEAADKDHSALVSGKSMDEVATQRGLTVDRPDPLARTDSLPGLGRVPALVNAVFELEPGAYTDPIQLNDTWVVATLKEKTASTIPELAKVRDRVESAYKLERGGDLAKAAADKFLQSATEKGTLDAAAAADKRKVEDTGGFVRAGAYIPKIGSSQPLKDLAFRLTDPGKPGGQVFIVATDAYVVALKERTKPSEEEITKQMESTRKSMLERRRQGAFTAYLKELKAKAKIQVDHDRLDQIPIA
jgi:peptidyl-prolyl cis-trans isomerase D